MLAAYDVINLMRRKGILFAQEAVLTTEVRALCNELPDARVDLKTQAVAFGAPGLWP
jgi:hypothetical protein